MLTFREDIHEFKLNGVVIPSITQTLEIAGLVDYSKVPPAILKASQDFGTAAHMATQLYDLGTLDFATLDKALRPYLDCWIYFKEKYGFKPLIIEKPMVSRIYRFAGIPDRIGQLKADLTTAEIKTTFELCPATALQTAAQVILHDEGKKVKDQIKRRCAVLLNETGIPKVEFYDGPEHKNDKYKFLAALTVANTKKEFGLCR